MDGLATGVLQCNLIADNLVHLHQQLDSGIGEREQRVADKAKRVQLSTQRHTSHYEMRYEKIFIF